MNRLSLALVSVIAALAAVCGESAFSRPEYATSEKVSCTQCHVTAWGGGPRTVFGKIYGTHGQGKSETTGSDLYYGDLRTTAYFPFKRLSEREHGVFLMEAAATANVPVVRSEDGSDTRVVATYNATPVSSQSLREAYVRFRQAGELERNWTLGRFYMPFGLLTDEHRTYTRMQTNMSLNNYNVGVALSQDLRGDFHVDLVAVNDFFSTGTPRSGQTGPGTVANLRWNPKELPFLLGLSGNYEFAKEFAAPYAGSLYGVLSLEQLTNSVIPASIQFESVLAKNWNGSEANTGGEASGLSRFFFTGEGAGLQSAVLESSSLGSLLYAKYNLGQKWKLFYKFDYLALDTSTLGTNFTRHGLGAEVYLNPNLILNFRAELATTPALLSTSDALAAQNDFFAMLRLWI